MRLCPFRAAGILAAALLLALGAPAIARADADEPRPELDLARPAAAQRRDPGGDAGARRVGDLPPSRRRVPGDPEAVAAAPRPSTSSSAPRRGRCKAGPHRDGQHLQRRRSRTGAAWSIRATRSSSTTPTRSRLPTRSICTACTIFRSTMDGVGGISQPLVPHGGHFVYRFVADTARHVHLSQPRRRGDARLGPLRRDHRRAGASAPRERISRTTTSK